MTETQVLLVLEMLDVPAGAVLYRTDKLGLNATPFAALGNPPTAVAVIRATLLALSTEQAAIVTGLITQYQAICATLAKGVSIQAGGVPGVQGLNLDPLAAKADVKQRLRSHVPFYTDWSTMETRGAEVANMRAAVLM